MRKDSLCFLADLYGSYSKVLYTARSGGYALRWVRGTGGSFDSPPKPLLDSPSPLQTIRAAALNPWDWPKVGQKAGNCRNRNVGNRKERFARLCEFLGIAVPTYPFVPKPFGQSCQEAKRCLTGADGFFIQNQYKRKR